MMRYQCEHRGWSRRRNSPGWSNPPERFQKPQGLNGKDFSIKKFAMEIKKIFTQNQSWSHIAGGWSYVNSPKWTFKRHQPAGTAWAPPPRSSSRSRARSGSTRTERSPSTRPCTHSRYAPAASLRFGSSEGKCMFDSIFHCPSFATFIEQ